MEKFDQYFESLDMNQRLIFIKKTAISVCANKVRLDKALEKEEKYGNVCGKGAGSTASANASKIAIIYQDQLDLLRHCAELI